MSIGSCHETRNTLFYGIAVSYSLLPSSYPYVSSLVPTSTAAAPAMNLKFFLPMGEKPPDKFGQGDDAIPTQVSLGILISSVHQIPEEPSVLQPAALTSTARPFIAIIWYSTSLLPRALTNGFLQVALKPHPLGHSTHYPPGTTPPTLTTILSTIPTASSSIVHPFIVVIWYIILYATGLPPSTVGQRLCLGRSSTTRLIVAIACRPDLPLVPRPNQLNKATKDSSLPSSPPARPFIVIYVTSATAATATTTSLQRLVAAIGCHLVAPSSSTLLYAATIMFPMFSPPARLIISTITAHLIVSIQLAADIIIATCLPVICLPPTALLMLLLIVLPPTLLTILVATAYALPTTVTCSIQINANPHHMTASCFTTTMANTYHHVCFSQVTHLSTSIPTYFAILYCNPHLLIPGLLDIVPPPPSMMEH